MKHYTTRYEKTIKCNCGNEVPTRWVFEGKMGLRTGEKSGIEKYCVKCANDEEYGKLVSEFSHFMQTK